MDPASIAGLVGTCLTIAGGATSFIRGINDLRTRYKELNDNVQALVTQTGAVRSAANSIQKWLNSNGAGLGKEERQSMSDSLQACGIIINSMRDGVRDVIGERAKGSGRWKFWDKAKFLWDQSQMDQYAIRLDHQVVALSLHLQALHLPNSSARRERLRSPEGAAIIEKGIIAASESSWSNSSGSPTGSSIFASESGFSMTRGRPTVSALTAANLALINEEQGPVPPPKDNGGPSGRSNVLPGRTRPQSVIGTEMVVKSKSAPIGSPVEVTEAASEIRSTLDEIRTVIESEVGKPSTKEVKTTLDRLRDLINMIRRLVRDPTNRSNSEISDLDKEAGNLFLELEEVLRSLEADLPIFTAVKTGNLEEFNQLCDTGLDIQTVNERGQTLLHVAAQEFKPDILEVLVDKGGLLETLDGEGKTVLHAIDFTAYSNATAITRMVRCLLKAGANAEVQFLKTGTILHRASLWTQTGSVDLLLHHGVEIDSKRDPRQETPLHLACNNPDTGSLKIVKRLLEAGADVSALTSAKRTPLDLACKKLINHEKALHLLTPDDGCLVSTIDLPCNQYRSFISTILVLLDYVDSFQINKTRRKDLIQTFAFRNIEDLTNVSNSDMRTELEEQREFALLSSDEELYYSIKTFYKKKEDTVEGKEKKKEKVKKKDKGKAREKISTEARMNDLTLVES